MLQAGFAETDITPPVGTHKIGWLKVIVSETILDPIFARVAVFRSAEERIAFVQLDTLSIAEAEVVAIRRGIAERYGFPAANVMVSATHNHAGPAVNKAGEVRKDEAYVRTLIPRVVALFGRALESAEPAEVGFGSGFEWRVAHNRRVVMRDGTVRTHGAFKTPDALCLEGPIDPEVAVIAARDEEGRLLGALVNFACHPTHHGGDTAISAGFPGVLAGRMRAGGCPVTLFLNGACGNVHTADPCAGGGGMSQEEAGETLAEDVRQILSGMTFRDQLRLRAASATVSLPYRKVTDEEIEGRTRGAQRFVDPAIYDRLIPALVKEIGAGGACPVEVQALFMDEHVLVGIPAEYFVEFGLRIKEAACPARALVVTCANGQAGYVPTREAFLRGGYETTFAPTSRLGHEAGDLLAETAIQLIKSKKTP